MVVEAPAIYQAGRIEFLEPVEPPADGSQVVVRYETKARHDWHRHFGVLSDEDAAAMMAAIEQGCERIDEDGW